MVRLYEKLRPFKDRGLYLQIKPQNKMELTGNTGSITNSEIESIKAQKGLLVLLLPENHSFSIQQILSALDACIERSAIIEQNTSFDEHGADLQALSVGREYLETVKEQNDINEL